MESAFGSRKLTQVANVVRDIDTDARLGVMVELLEHKRTESA